MPHQDTPEPTPAKNTFLRLESEVRSYCRSFPTVFTSAQGATLRDASGRTYLDFLAGCSTLNYGHNDPDLKAALIDYIAGDGIAHGLDMYTEAKEAFLAEFEATVLKPRGLDYRVQFPGPTGANTVEAAIKLARKATGRHNVVAFTNGFHGATLGALAATGNSHHRGGAGIALTGVTRVPYAGYHGEDVDTAEMLDRMLNDPSSGVDAPAAILLETVQGEGGLNVAPVDWLRRIAQIARAHGALLIIDDIQAGCGRAGTFFSFENSGVKPDIVTLAKSLSGMGLPFALTLVAPEYDLWKPGEHNGTFRGNCHAFVTARAALAKFWRDGSFQTAIEQKSALLERRLTEMVERFGQDFRVKGRRMMRGLDVRDGDLASRVCSEAFLRGLVIETSGAHDEVVKVLAPLTITETEFAQGLDILERAVAAALETPAAVAAE